MKTVTDSPGLKEMLGFAPDAVRGRDADDQMHRALADSLAHLAAATSDAMPDTSAMLVTLSRRLAKGDRVAPVGFALYFRLARALMANDRTLAAVFAARLLAVPMRPKGMGAKGWCLRVAGTPEAAPLLALLADDGDPLLQLASVSAEDAAAFVALLDQGSALMQAELPTLHAEIDAIIHEVLLAHAAPGAVMEFDGASHYQFWGLLALNPRHHRTPLAVVEVLAHEAAHALLFGLTIEEPLVLNPDSETYASPLRRDPRPMDGIYHATFVSARMAWAMEHLAKSPRLGTADRQAAAEAARRDREYFAAGDQIVAAHGR
ncbi:MAG: HEXXH motif-containing putative peptide modification protein, partial [Paracoccaceae bacterium]|nr:HEXXH motif-containing putative peptide modification protein [Paracoccaceae bacterium]